MTLTPGDDLNETRRQRTRDQFALLQRAGSTAVIVDSDDPADFTFACHSARVLVNDNQDVARLQRYFQGRIDDDNGVFDGLGAPEDPQPDGLPFVRYVLPNRRDAVPGDRSLLLTLDELDQDPETRDLARPDHVVHICPGGRPSHCPATEPTETDREPWPTRADVNPAAGDGSGVRVVVIDTGWYDPARDGIQPSPWPWIRHVVNGEPEPEGIRDPNDPNAPLRQYAGHGTFITGVIASIAPEAEIWVLSLPRDPDLLQGGVFESEIVSQLDAALALDPHLINLSAGCPTRLNRPARGFERWWDDVTSKTPEPQWVLVASAGNNASPWAFWPASFDWALGVGSLDRDGHVSNFSNWGDSVDVYALGRNIVNAFPKGDYVCQESPDRGDVRSFNHWRARWSGTSFSAPLVTGLIAQALSQQEDEMDARVARDAVLGGPPLGPLPTDVNQAGRRMMPVLRAGHVPVAAESLLIT